MFPFIFLYFCKELHAVVLITQHGSRSIAINRFTLRSEETRLNKWRITQKTYSMGLFSLDGILLIELSGIGRRDNWNEGGDRLECRNEVSYGEEVEMANVCKVSLMNFFQYDSFNFLICQLKA